MIVWQLFTTFMVIGFVSFGGGYAMIPVIGAQVEKHHWMTPQAYLNATAVAGMSPGPIATNTAIFVGYQTAGLPGAIISAIGIILPSLILVILAAAFFYKVYKYKTVRAAFYGLRPIVTGVIFFGAIKFALASGMMAASDLYSSVMLWLIFAGSLYALLKLRTHPFYVIVISGLVGIAVFT
nr:chromate transporter [Gorillibacterium massiliense]